MDEQLSRAVVAYLGKGRSAFPRTDAGAVAPDAPATERDALLARVRNVVDECLAIEVDWHDRSLAAAGQVARDTMARRHPGLSPDALDALRWLFTYTWR